MREIKFRAKRVDNGEWVYGDLRQYVNNGIFPDFYTIDTMSAEPNGIGTNHIVLEETVGQYTGLCDKNSKEIYEGDIVLTQPIKNKPYSKSAKAKRLDKEYFDKGTERLNKLKSQMSIFD